MAVTLKVVSENPLIEPPYPADTKVKGWKFTIDHERLNQSDTWAIAPADMRPWLLMLWTVAWQQMPAGSFSDDDQVISAKIGMDPRTFAANKDILMRGWFRCSDGRLYHPVIVDQVSQMLDCKEKERERKHAYRMKIRGECPADVPRDRHGKDLGKTTPEPEPEPEPEPSINTHLSTSESETRERVITRSDPVPFEKIQSLWAEICPHLPQPVKLSPARKAIIRARWNDELPDLDSWRQCFGYVAASNFLSGRSTPAPGRKPFRCSLDWICKQENLLKLYEGRYDNA